MKGDSRWQKDVPVGHKPVIEMAYEDGLIEDKNLWYKMVENRHESTHEYNSSDDYKRFDDYKDLIKDVYLPEIERLEESVLYEYDHIGII